MLAQKRFDEDADEEMKVGGPAQASELAGAQIRMGGRMGQQIQNITNTKGQDRQGLGPAVPQQPQGSAFEDDF